MSYQKLYKKGKLYPKTYEYMREKYDKRDDPDNIWGVGMTKTEFANLIILELLGEDWYCSDPLSETQINEVAFLEIIEKYRKRRRK